MILAGTSMYFIGIQLYCPVWTTQSKVAWFWPVYQCTVYAFSCTVQSGLPSVSCMILAGTSMYCTCIQSYCPVWLYQPSTFSATNVAWQDHSDYISFTVFWWKRISSEPEARFTEIHLRFSFIVPSFTLLYFASYNILEIATEKKSILRCEIYG